jgi:hypothetical protein
MRRDRSENRRITRLSAVLLVVLLLLGAMPAAADSYDSKRSGHPLRVLAYIAHPVGVIIDTLIFRPFHWLGSKEPIKTLVGQKD